MDMFETIKDAIYRANAALTSLQQLAQELGYPGDTGDVQGMNHWLHHEIMRRLSESDRADAATNETGVGVCRICGVNHPVN